MSYDMVMRLPIMERRLMIQKHNMEQDEINKAIDGNGSNTTTYGGESVNAFARLEQSNKANGGR